MLTVAILINGNPIVAKSVVNQGDQNDKGETAYKLDSGEILWHQEEDGAVELAKQMLNCIRNGSRSDNIMGDSRVFRTRCCGMKFIGLNHNPEDNDGHCRNCKAVYIGGRPE